jgi:hypothetical protein
MRTARMPGYCCASGYCFTLRNTLVPGSRPSTAVCGKPTCHRSNDQIRSKWQTGKCALNQTGGRCVLRHRPPRHLTDKPTARCITAR